MVPAIASFFSRAGRADAPHTDEIRRLLTRSLDLWSAHLTSQAFGLGSRPSLPDFALYGMLDAGPLCDAKPRKLIAAQWPALIAYHQRFAEANTSSEWLDPTSFPATLQALLRFAAEDFGSFLRANAAALAAGDQEACWNGTSIAASGFTHQCRRDLAAEIAALTPADRVRLDKATEGTALVALYLCGRRLRNPCAHPPRCQGSAVALRRCAAAHVKDSHMPAARTIARSRRQLQGKTTG